MLTMQDKKQDDKGKLKFHRTERSSTWVQRSLRLPESADLSKISAKYTDGVLQMEVGTRRLLCCVVACLTAHCTSLLTSGCVSL
jgi:Hsp20/alpha crystallin family